MLIGSLLTDSSISKQVLHNDNNNSESSKFNTNKQQVCNICNSTNKPTKCIKEAIKKELETTTISNKNNPVQDDSFYILDLGQLTLQHQKWKKCFPRIQPYYAVKCNPDIEIIQYLVSLGLGFDCASGPEIQLVLNHGADPSKIIYAHTCKQVSHLKFAADCRVHKMTFDNIDELYKIKMHYPAAKLLLRILTDDTKAKWGLGIKYGAPMSEVDNLLKTAKTLGLNIVGVSFHVGSGCSNVSAYQSILQNSRTIFDRAKEFGFNCDLLDIGGGFFGVDYPEKPSFEEIASVIRDEIDSLFPSDVQVIAEPGRYYATSTLTLCCQIVGRKIVSKESCDKNTKATANKKYIYYVNDLLHSSFATRLFYSDVIDLKEAPYKEYSSWYEMLMRNGIYTYGERQTDEETYPSTVWGHTDEPEDCLGENIQLPILNIGDWIYAENLGAYAIATCHFAGFEKPRTIYVDTSTC